MNQKEILEVRITYELWNNTIDEDNLSYGYRADYEDENITLLSSWELDINEQYKITGTYEAPHEKYGKQFKIITASYLYPEFKLLTKFKNKYKIKGLGKITMQSLIDVYHNTVFDALQDVSSISSKILNDSIKAQIEKLKNELEHYKFLVNWPELQNIVMRKENYDKFTDNPYSIASMPNIDIIDKYYISTVGKCEDEKRKYGILGLCLREVGLFYCKDDEINSLISKIEYRKHYDFSNLNYEFKSNEDGYVTTPENEILENNVCKSLAIINSSNKNQESISVKPEESISAKEDFISAKEDFISAKEEDFDKTLNKEQLMALDTFMKCPITILRGRPGTGKSYLIRSTVNYLNKIHAIYFVMAFTGVVCAKYRDISSSVLTIHSFLFKHGSPKSNVYILIDEASMISLELVNKLLNILIKYKNVHILFCGDENQLPPGCGSFFQYIIDIFPTITLLTIKRQNDGNPIIDAADAIIDEKEIKQNRIKEKGESIAIYTLNGENLKDIIIKLAKKDYKFITFLRKDCMKINKIVQKNFLCDNASKKCPNSRHFHVGDIVMNLVNDNFTHKIMNGDIGQITSIENEMYAVKFFCGEFLFRHYTKQDSEKELVEVGIYNFEHLELAYYMTINKCQGSEYNNVCYYLSSYSSYNTKKHAYTAITRAKKNCFILQEYADIIIQNIRNTRILYTNIDKKLKIILNNLPPGEINDAQESSLSVDGETNDYSE